MVDRRSVIVKTKNGVHEFIDPATIMIAEFEKGVWKFVIEVRGKDEIYEFTVFDVNDYKNIENYISEIGYGVIAISGKCEFNVLERKK